jgi:hypothetical protein
MKSLKITTQICKLIFYLLWNINLFLNIGNFWFFMLDHMFFTNFLNNFGLFFLILSLFLSLENLILFISLSFPFSKSSSRSLLFLLLNHFIPQSLVVLIFWFQISFVIRVWFIKNVFNFFNFFIDVQFNLVQNGCSIFSLQFL